MGLTGSVLNGHEIAIPVGAKGRAQGAMHACRQTELPGKTGEICIEGFTARPCFANAAAQGRVVGKMLEQGDEVREGLMEGA